VKGFVAERRVTIKAPVATVWDALTDPALVRDWMHGTNLHTDWQVGSPVTWTGEWKGQEYEDKGEVLEVEQQKRLTMTHWSPMGGSEDKPENYHTVSYQVEAAGADTVLTLTQDNNPSQAEADTMAENNWGPILEGLKGVAEREAAKA
jgi:uncharacterized protein YndB with AHSA1/START domain